MYLPALRKINVFLLLILLWASCCFVEADVIDVYVYDNEFSINPPGQPIEAAIITEGDTIRWIWFQGDHTTTSVTGSIEIWDSQIDVNVTEFSYQFNTPGLYWYYCTKHGGDNGDGTANGMASTITVLSSSVGACCLPSGHCSNTNEATCLSQGGVFQGEGTSCETTTCVGISQLDAVKDNVLYETLDGSRSNGLGRSFYVGKTSNGIRRSVIAFELSGIPSYAVITDVQLQLYCDKNNGSDFYIRLYPLLQDWGEGTSDAGGNTKDGTTSTTNDATWLHTFYNTGFWDVTGGNFDPDPSDSALINAEKVYFSWNSVNLASDVQYWIHNPDSNFGWILRGDETTNDNGKGFASLQNSDPSLRPLLIVQFTLPDTGVCCYPDFTCGITSETLCNASGGTYKGNNTDCGSVSCSSELTPFLDSLPLPAVAVPTSGTAGGAAHYDMTMDEQFQQLHSDLSPTRVWGYNGSYPGPTIEAYRDQQVTVNWINDLRVAETGLLRTEHPLIIDQCLHGPDHTGDTCMTVVHLHGGKVAPHSDGYPEETFPPGESSPTYIYPNIQRAATLWYHDHAMGITRLNVQMGLAGFYILRDDQEAALNIPKGENEIPLVIQDRSFNPDGSFQYPDAWTDVFFGDVVLVNG